MMGILVVKGLNSFLSKINKKIGFLRKLQTPDLFPFTDKNA